MFKSKIEIVKAIRALSVQPYENDNKTFSFTIGNLSDIMRLIEAIMVFATGVELEKKKEEITRLLNQIDELYLEQKRVREVGESYLTELNHVRNTILTRDERISELTKEIARLKRMDESNRLLNRKLNKIQTILNEYED